MWAIHMHAHELLSCSQQRLVSCFCCLRHNVIEHGVAHPARARNDDCTESRIRIWNVSEERLVQCIVEAREALFVSSCRTSALAWNWNIDTLQHDGHVLRKQTKGGCAYTQSSVCASGLYSKIAHHLHHRQWHRPPPRVRGATLPRSVRAKCYPIPTSRSERRDSTQCPAYGTRPS